MPSLSLDSESRQSRQCPLRVSTPHDGMGPPPTMASPLTTGVVPCAVVWGLSRRRAGRIPTESVSGRIPYPADTRQVSRRSIRGGLEGPHRLDPKLAPCGHGCGFMGEVLHEARARATCKSRRPCGCRLSLAHVALKTAAGCHERRMPTRQTADGSAGQRAVHGLLIRDAGAAGGGQRT